MNFDVDRLFQRFSTCRIAVVGDIMLDVYLWGQVSRISPEAPVPVVNIARRTSCLGGAGNVMRNLSQLGCNVLAFGVVGDDEGGREVCSLIQREGAEISGIRIDSARCTTEKRRVIAGSQQLLREDFEQRTPVTEELRSAIVEQVIAAIRQRRVDAVIFEDYAKGLLDASMLQRIIAAAQGQRIFTTLDPKPGGVQPVPGLTVIKPNRGEAFALSGVRDDHPELPPESDPALAEAAARLFAKWESETLLISLAAQGMALYRRGETVPEIIPTRAREVFDVSGAGDTVTATYTLALAAGENPARAAQIANLAAGVVVGKVGTAPIRKDELEAALHEFAQEKRQ